MAHRSLILFDVDNVLVQPTPLRRLPGTAEALAQLRHAGTAVLSLVTPDDQEQARLKTTEVGLERYLDFAVGGYGTDRAAQIADARDKAKHSYGNEFTVLVVTSATAPDLPRLRPAADVVVAVGPTANRPAGADHVVSSLLDMVALAADASPVH